MAFSNILTTYCANSPAAVAGKLEEFKKKTVGKIKQRQLEQKLYFGHFKLNLYTNS
jgi:hypothetical protein